MPSRDHVLGQTLIDGGHYKWPAGKDMVRWNGSDDWHLVLSLRGTGLIGASGDPQLPAPPGRIALWRPGTTQGYRVAPGCRQWERLWIHVHPPAAWLDLLAWPALEPGLMGCDLPPETSRAVAASLRDCIRHVRLGLGDSQRFAMNRLEHAMLLVARHIAAQRPSTDARIDRLVSVISAELTRDWAVAAMAATVGLSQAQVTRLCARNLGESPHRLVERLRLEESQRLLSGDRPILTVGQAVGFSDVSHFTRRFRARFGVTPGAWRKRVQAGRLNVKPDDEHRD